MPKRSPGSRSGRLSPRALGLLTSLAITYFVPSRRPKWLQPPTLDERFGDHEKTHEPSHSQAKSTRKKRLHA